MTWLRPEAGIVPHQPRPEDEQLLSWCQNEDQFRVQLLCGRGGQGKTTSALHLIRTLGERGWLAGLVDLTEARQEGASRRRWAELEAAVGSRPVRRSRVLLVVDYAEHEPFVLQRLLTVIRGAPSVRLLLLSRSEGAWWSDLVTDPVWSSLVDPAPLRLRSLTEHVNSERLGEIHSEAVRCFASQMSQTVVVRDASPARKFTTTLDLYADALLRVLDAEAESRGNGPVHGTGDPITDLMAHELRHLHTVLSAHNIELGSYDRQLVLLAPFLLPAPTVEDAARAIRALRLEASLEEPVVHRLARLLGELYPDDEGAVWAAPRPDRLPDSHVLTVAAQAASDTDWVRLLTRLCAAEDEFHAAAVTRSLLRVLSTPDLTGGLGNGVRRVAAGFEQLVRSGNFGFVLGAILLRPGEFTHAVGEALSDQGNLSAEDVARLDSFLGVFGFSTRRALDLVLVSARRVRDTVPDEEASLEAVDLHADELNWHATRLAEVGRREQAVEAVRAAVTLREHLAEIDPARYEPDLAMSLSNLALVLNDIGASREALPFVERAVALRKRLLEEDESHLCGLSSSLSNLGTILHAIGRREEATDALRTAVDIRTRLADEDFGANAELLGGLLNNYANALAKAGEVGKALQVVQRSVQIFAFLVDKNCDAHLPDYATVLSSYGGVLGDAGLFAQAVEPIQEAIEILESLAPKNPEAILPVLALTEVNVANALWKAGRRTEALPHARRSAELRDQLCQTGPDVRRLELVESLSNLAVMQGGLGQKTEASRSARAAAEIGEDIFKSRDDAAVRVVLAKALLTYSGCLRDEGDRNEAVVQAKRSVFLHESLVDTQSQAYMDALAMSLTTFAVVLSDVGRFRECRQPAERAVEIFEELVELGTAEHRPGLALAVSNVGALYLDLGMVEESTAAALRVVDLWEQLVDIDAQAHQAELARALDRLADRLSGRGRPEDALRHGERAVQLWKSLDSAHPGAGHGSDLVDSLLKSADVLSDLGRHEDAVQRSRTAVETARSLCPPDSPQVRVGLALALNSLGGLLFDLGQSDEGTSHAREAVEIMRLLDEINPDVYRLKFAMCLATLAGTLADVGEDDAMEEALRAVALNEWLVERDIDAHSGGLALSLALVGGLLAMADRVNEAVVPMRRAVALLEQLAERRPGVATQLARTRDNLAVLEDLLVD
ncbi:tetratricopeptide repeat protein [Lentzea sp. BCCO 10_0798]|uniref:Tetratricopeptide repeat protein n=1 Tax=Lentzea kristufekii TaxID=3095430 RepID=A0ABU4TLU3_9PSEU|nr:tetratricopeptide repeat protein [Lentzea sp. BCCO 10_0798]MDX8049250.1 tetratricopeptide repeat protein [Lentzea sp. BCCO 10_0798]